MLFLDGGLVSVIVCGRWRQLGAMHSERGGRWPSIGVAPAISISPSRTLLRCSSSRFKILLAYGLFERDELTELLQAQHDTDADRVVCDACLTWRCDQANGEDLMDHTPYWADPEFALRQVCTAVEKAKALPHRCPGFLVYGQRAGTGPFTGVFPDLITIPNASRRPRPGYYTVHRWERTAVSLLLQSCTFSPDAIR